MSGSDWTRPEYGRSDPEGRQPGQGGPWPPAGAGQPGPGGTWPAGPSWQQGGSWPAGAPDAAPQYQQPNFGPAAGGYGPQPGPGGPGAYGPTPYALSPYGQAPYGQPVVAPKSPGISLLASFFVPGRGSMINGEVAKGVGILLGYVVCLLLVWLLLPGLVAIGLWVWGMVDAYTGAQRWNAQRGIVS